MNEIAVTLPQVIGVILILIIGWIIARIIRRLSVRGLKLVRFYCLTEKSGIESFLEKGGVKVGCKDDKQIPGQIIGKARYLLAGF